jgi:hypothetical protein
MGGRFAPLIARRLLKELVGASGFEPPTSWSRTRMTMKINDLAPTVRIRMRFDTLFQLKMLHAVATSSVDSRHRESMQGVGILSVIVDDLT